MKRLLPEAAPSRDAPLTDDWAGVRAMTPDRLPYAGAIPDVTTPVSGDPGFASLPRVSGLYLLTGLGARGTLWAPLLADFLASRVTGEPSPLPRRFADALDPGRYWLRALRRAT